MTEIELIVDLHKNSERQGPGSKKDTLMALSFLDLPSQAEVKLADMGCGSGGQTINLAQNSNLKITAVDLFPAFLNELNQKSRKLGLEGKISTLEASMENLPFTREEFDVIWSEGAIYNMGFTHGIQNWKKFLKNEGYLAVSEITWTTNSRPQEIEEFWISEYPEIDTAGNKIKVLEDNGFSLTGYFVLPESSWTDHYYTPLSSRFESFLKRHAYSDPSKKVVRDNKSEIELYMKYKEYYSYGFYIARKNK